MQRHLLVKDLKIFLRDVSQWSQLLLLLALVLVYLYNFRVLDLDRNPYMSGMIKNVYAFVNLAMAGLVMATVCARFVFPAVSAEGAAFWIIRTAPVSLRAFLWSKFWTGFIPVFLLTELLTVAANHFLGVEPFLRMVAAAAVLLMSLALVGLATGLGARYPRFNADNPSQVAGLVRRRGVHDPRRPVHDPAHRAGRLAGVDVYVVRGAPAVAGTCGLSSARRGRIRRRTRAQRRHLALWHAFRHPGARIDGMRIR